MVLTHQLLVNGVDFVEELPNPLLKKKPIFFDKI
jgi:hypothetical protein